MSWNPIDYQGIVALNKPLVEQLTHYLEEKESALVDTLVRSFEGVLSVTPQEIRGEERLKLTDVVELLSQKVQERYSENAPLPTDWKKPAEAVNTSLWGYAEVLEGCVTELFQQLKQVGFEDWHFELLQVVDAIKEIIAERLSGLLSAVRRLESLLREYRGACEKQKGGFGLLKKFFLFWVPILDRSLLFFLRRCLSQLKAQYKKFTKRYEEYFRLNGKIEKSLQKFSAYSVISTLDDEDREMFLKVYRLLKLWKVNLKNQSLPLHEPVRALRRRFSIERVVALFKRYVDGMRKSLYERSRIFKRNPSDIFTDKGSKAMMTEVILGYHAELHTLGATIVRYRDFLLRTDPNPYVRTRWGFAEWVTGQEPKQTKNLLDLMYETETLDEQYKHLHHSLEEGPDDKAHVKLRSITHEIEHQLREMGQPLTARHILKNAAERILELLERLDELGTFDQDVVPFTSSVLSRVLRADWQYHVVYEIPEFHRIYKTHMGILGTLEDRQHFNRLNKFETLIKQLEEWVTKRETQRHLYEIEQDMSDMKGFLQDFLAHTQRIHKDEGLSPEKKKVEFETIARMLLEYRYLFGHFFHHLHQYAIEGKLIRNQFLFVDQYFDAIENLIS